MKSTMLEPLTIRRLRPSQTTSMSSIASYPEIPCRHSSLSASVSNGSFGPATSTRTPSLSDSQYQIEVVKVRNLGIEDSRDSCVYHHGSSEDPFEERKHKIKHNHNNHRLVRRLAVRWSSGSWDSIEPCITSSPTRASSNRRTLTPELGHDFGSHSDHAISDYLCPLDLPVAFVNVKSKASSSQIGMGPMSLSTSVHVSVDVGSIPFPGTSGLAPLDIIILLDSLSQPSVNYLTQITLGSTVLASNLVQNHDRVALMYIDPKAKHGVGQLLPLGFHSFDAIRSALNKFAQYQHLIMTYPNIGNAIRRISDMFGACPRAAFCQLFFVSATPPAHLSLPWMNQAIGFHTITPQTCLPLTFANFQAGWHIAYDVGMNDTCPRGSHFIRNVSRVVRQLRTGIRPGSILDLKLSIIPGSGCHMHSFMESFQLTSLRPGETWIIPLQIEVPPAFQQLSSVSDRWGSPVHSPIFEDLLEKINGLIAEYSGETTQAILKARVEYRHSLLPAPNNIHVESHLTVARVDDTVSCSSRLTSDARFMTLSQASKSSCDLSTRSESA
ncbi:hypothetical protein N7462_005999 [Penicillium macrosclerotiorum]|uniref:uncharacterized protein n=1 Tax=Penicillium macrosclerotiorum TaxID=303699 RepID=UPI002546778B|nr:uncharacterized protein N7462_005999 [Penicillium macrosclerotiorum]KAJ5682834.1 hypothetical protein N7462_005999 [Penicillium macrosclerotiorum]